MYFSESQVNIVIFMLRHNCVKGKPFELITVFGTTMLSMGKLKYLDNTTIGIENSVVYN